MGIDQPLRHRLRSPLLNERANRLQVHGRGLPRVRKGLGPPVYGLLAQEDLYRFDILERLSVGDR
jgi:hypothetical protein